MAQNERGLAVAEIRNKQVTVIDPAPRRSVARGRKTAAELTTPIQPDDLICPAVDILTVATLREQIATAVAEADDQRRAAVVAVLQAAQTKGRGAIAAAFGAVAACRPPADGHLCLAHPTRS